MHGLGMDTSQHGRGEAGPGAQARGAQIFLLPSRSRSDGHRREPWFQRPGSESWSAAVLSLVSDSASLSPPEKCSVVPGKQVITSLGYPKVLNLESGTREILTGEVNIQSYIIIAHMIMKWPCS